MIKKNTFLGELCKRKHDYKNTGKSLMWKKGNRCIQCKKISNAKILQDKKLYVENFKDEKPECFDSLEDWKSWVNASKEVRMYFSTDYCADCSKEYKTEMVLAGRCGNA